MSGSPDQSPTQAQPPPAEHRAPCPQASVKRGRAQTFGGFDKRRVAVGAGAALLVLLVAGVAYGASQLGIFCGAPAAPQRVVAPGGQGYGRMPQSLPQRGPVQPRLPRGFGLPLPGAGAVTISAIDGSNVTVTSADGWSRTITVGSSTTISRGGQTITVGDLKVGDQIRFRETRNADGTTTVTAITVVLPRVTGQVTATSADTITIQRADGTTMAIHVGTGTTYQVPGIANATLANVAVGMIVIAEGTQNPDGSLSALVVYAAAKR